MTSRRPLVTKDGFITELPTGDTVLAGATTTEVVAGSGLIGGGLIDQNPQLDISLPPNPSGLIFVGDSLGNDGYAQATADAALASGIDAGTIADTQVVSGNAALSTAVDALASGNAALDLIPGLTGGGPLERFTAAGTILSGMPVGVDDTGRVQAVAVDRVSVDDLVTTSGRRLQGQDTTFYAPGPPVYIGTYDDAQVCVQGLQPITSSNDDGYRIMILSGTSPELINAVDTTNTSNPYKFDHWAGKTTEVDRVIIGYTTNNPSFNFYQRNGTYNPDSVTLTLTAQSSIVANVNVNYLTFATVSGTNQYSWFSRGSSSYPNFRRFSIADNGTMTSLSNTNLASHSSAFHFHTYNAHEEKTTAVWRGDSLYLWGASIDKDGTTNTAAAINSERTDYSTVNYLPNSGKTVCCAKLTNSQSGVAFVLEASGTTLVPGPYATLTSGTTASNYIQVIPLNDHPNRCLFYVQSQANPTSYSFTRLAEISGNNINFISGNNDILEAGVYLSTYTWSNYIDDFNQALITGRDYANSYSTYAITTTGSISNNPMPLLNGKTNYMGVSQETVSSGDSVLVALPGFTHVGQDGDFSTGSSYYLDTINSGLTASPTEPQWWDGDVAWNRVGTAVSSSGIVLLNSL